MPQPGLNIYVAKGTNIVTSTLYFFFQAEDGIRCLIRSRGLGNVYKGQTDIGKNVTIYQGVTLGGVSANPGKRHPTIGDNVIIGAGSKILGPLNIGENTKIGANSVVIDDIPENSTVVGVPGKVVGKSFSSIAPDLYHNKLPDPSGEDILRINNEIEELKEQQKNLKS